MASPVFTASPPLTALGPACSTGGGKIPWGRTWHPTPVFLPGESLGQRSLVGYSPCGCQDSDTAERLNTQPSPRCTPHHTRHSATELLLWISSGARFSKERKDWKALESSPNQPPSGAALPRPQGSLPSTELIPGARKVGVCWLRGCPSLRVAPLGVHQCGH